jgi:hypothetical protein
VMTIHVFMLNPQCSCFRIGAGPRFSLAVLHGLGSAALPGELPCPRRNLDIDSENGSFSVVAFEPVRRQARHRPSQYWECRGSNAKKFSCRAVFLGSSRISGGGRSSPASPTTETE